MEEEVYRAESVSDFEDIMEDVLEEYRFYLWNSGGGITLLRRDFEDGSYILVNEEICSPVDQQGCSIAYYDEDDEINMCLTLGELINLLKVKK